MNNTGISRAIRNINRSVFRSFVVVFMMTITFFMLGALLFVMYISQNLVNYFVQAAEVIGYFKEDVTEEQILTVKREFEQLDYVVEVTYISKEDAMKSFIEENEDNKEIIESVTVNPFPAHLNIKSNDLSRAEEISSKFSENELIFEVDDLGDVQNTLQRIVDTITFISLALLIVFSISTVFVIFLTTGLTIYSQKDEIRVMRVVGASSWYISSPYFFQSLIYAFTSVLISSAVMVGILTTQYDRIMSALFERLEMPSMSVDDIVMGVLILVVFAMLLSSASSYFALRRYIKA